MCVCGGVVEIGILALVVTGAWSFIKKLFGVPVQPAYKPAKELGTLGDDAE